MYCGDETGSFVGDIGSHSARFGYGGDDTPKYVVPSYCARSVQQPPSSCYHPRWKDADLKTPLRMAHVSPEQQEQPVTDPTQYLQQGDTIEDWDAYEQMWQASFDALSVRDTLKHTKGGGNYLDSNKPATTENKPASTTLRSSSSQTGQGKCVHPLLVVAPGCTHIMGGNANSSHTQQLREITELMMETMEAKALFVAPTPMLAAFSLGRQTAMVVDVGAAGCRVTPVVDGLLLKQSQRRSGRGGDWLGNVQWKALLSSSSSTLLQNKDGIRARYQLHPQYPKESKGGVIFHRWAMQDLMYEFRTSEHVKLATWCSDASVPFANLSDKNNNSNNKNTDNNKMDVVDDANNSSSPYYTLPDGTRIDLNGPLGKDLCRTPELLFTDTVPFLSTTETSLLLDQEHSTLSNANLPKLVYESLSAVRDVDTRKDLATSIVLCGAASAGLEARLSWEISQFTTFKTKVLASKHHEERSCAAWIGGSILSSLGSFQQLWLSKEEYDEYGATLAVQRFP